MRKLLAISAITFVVLGLSGSMLAGDQALVLNPQTVTITLSTSQQHVDLSAICDRTPCHVTWQVVYSNSAMGALAYTNGYPVAVFNSGTQPGTAFVTVKDGRGNTALGVIQVSR
jgi:hypothetical protein